jgi:hypothetical protein
VPERAVGPLLVVVEAPGFDLLPRVLERNELMYVQALVAQAPVEGLDVGILHGFAGVDEVERDAAVIRPIFDAIEEAELPCTPSNPLPGASTSPPLFRNE